MNWPLRPRTVASILGSALAALPRFSLDLRPSRPQDPRDAPRFAVRSEEDDIRFFTVRGGHLPVTDALVHLLRGLPEPMGLVLVEADSGCEWVGSTSLKRAQVLEAVMSLRDVLGRGPLDFAAYSQEAGTEVYFDRWGTLEIRAGSWKEGMLCRFLENRGFKRTARMSVLPPKPDAPESEEDAPPAHAERLARICVGLGLSGGLSRPVPKSS